MVILCGSSWMSQKNVVFTVCLELGSQGCWTDEHKVNKKNKEHHRQSCYLYNLYLQIKLRYSMTYCTNSCSNNSGKIEGMNHQIIGTKIKITIKAEMRWKALKSTVTSSNKKNKGNQRITRRINNDDRPTRNENTISRFIRDGNSNRGREEKFQEKNLLRITVVEMYQQLRIQKFVKKHYVNHLVQQANAPRQMTVLSW